MINLVTDMINTLKDKTELEVLKLWKERIKINYLLSVNESPTK
jgi:hypothetical protein